MTPDSTFSVGDVFDPAKYEPFELGQVQWIRRPGEGDRADLSCGFWHVTPEEAPEPFDLPFHQDETVHIVEGHIRVEVIGGATHELVPGTAVSFNKGIMTRWTVLKPTTEFFIYS